MNWVRQLRPRQGKERGAVTVELAFVAPMLLLFLIGSLQVGLVVLGNSAASNAAREGARAASIRFECADNHISVRCPANPSTNYTYIRGAVLGRLAGLVKTDSVTVSVLCRAGSASGTVITCEQGHVDPDTDVIVVTVGWRHIGATPYVADSEHSSVARAVVIGRPDLSLLAPEPDNTAPSLLSAYVFDTNADGVLDQIKLTFSEDIEQTGNISAFTLTNSVTGSNNIASATVLNRVVTLTLSGGSTVNTAPGAMRIALAAAANGVRDLWGNQASFAATPLNDAAAPILTGLSDTNGLIGGYPNALDSLTLTFSEPIVTSLSTTTVAYNDPQGGGNDTMQISGITAGPLTTNSNGYNSSDDSTVSVGALVSTFGNNVTVSVLSPLLCTPLLCPGLSAGSDSSPWTFTPATTLADVVGNAAAGARTISNLF